MSALFADAVAEVFADPMGLRYVSVQPAPGDFDPWAERLAGIGDPGLAAVRHAGRDEHGRAVLVVEAAPSTLAERLVETGALNASEVVHIGRFLAGGLAALHASGLTHGAVCPSTIAIADRAFLAGYDTFAPGLARPGARNPFAPPGDAGPAADVCALAMTLYRAMGGQGAASPLHGVPDALTALLTASTAADPAARPTAAAFRDVLAGIAVPTVGMPPVPLSAEHVGADVRPLTSKVVSINLAVAGAAAGGAAVAAGVVVGQALPGLAGIGTTAQAGAAAAKSGLGLLLTKIGAGVVAAAVVVTGVVVGVNAFSGGGTGGEDPVIAAGDSSKPQGPPSEEIKGYDWANATFEGYAEDPVKLTNGKADVYDEGNFTEMAGPPLYADLDEDGDLDAVTLLVRHGGNSEPTAMFFWLWTDGKAVQIPRMVAFRVHCGPEFEAPEIVGNTVRMKIWERVVETPCASVPESFEISDVTIAVRDGVPVSLDPFGAVERCSAQFSDRPVSGVPLVWPEPSARPVGDAGEFTSITAHLLEGDTWAIARLVRTDGSISCGWVPASAVS